MTTSLAMHLYSMIHRLFVIIPGVILVVFPAQGEPNGEYTFTAKLNKEMYLVNEPVYLTLTLRRNLGLPAEEIRYPVLDPNAGSLRIRIEMPDGKTVLYKRGNFSRTAFGKEDRMEGGEQIQTWFVITWNSETGDFVTGATGHYFISAEIAFEDMKTEEIAFDVIEPSSDLREVSRAFSTLEVARSLDTRHAYPINDTKLRTELFEFIGSSVDNVYDAYLAVYFVVCESRTDAEKDLDRAGVILDSALDFVPASFPLRPELLYYGSRIAYEKGDKFRALSLLEELKSDYPGSEMEKKVSERSLNILREETHIK